MAKDGKSKSNLLEKLTNAYTQKTTDAKGGEHTMTKYQPSDNLLLDLYKNKRADGSKSVAIDLYNPLFDKVPDFGEKQLNTPLGKFTVGYEGRTDGEEGVYGLPGAYASYSSPFASHSVDRSDGTHIDRKQYAPNGTNGDYFAFLDKDTRPDGSKSYLAEVQTPFINAFPFSEKEIKTPLGNIGYGSEGDGSLWGRYTPEQNAQNEHVSKFLQLLGALGKQ